MCTHVNRKKVKCVSSASEYNSSGSFVVCVCVSVCVCVPSAPYEYRARAAGGGGGACGADIDFRPPLVEMITLFFDSERDEGCICLTNDVFSFYLFPRVGWRVESVCPSRGYVRVSVLPLETRCRQNIICGKAGLEIDMKNFDFGYNIVGVHFF